MGHNGIHHVGYVSDGPPITYFTLCPQILNVVVDRYYAKIPGAKHWAPAIFDRLLWVMCSIDTYEIKQTEEVELLCATGENVQRLCFTSRSRE